MSSKVSQLTENTAPDASDYLYVIDDPAGTPASTKMTIANFIAKLPGQADGFIIGGGTTPRTLTITTTNVLLNQSLRTTDGPTFAGISLTEVQTTTISDAGTTTSPALLTLRHNTSGTPAANFGVSISMRGETTTTENTEIASITGQWQVATHASRRGTILFSVADAETPKTVTLYPGSAGTPSTDSARLGWNANPDIGIWRNGASMVIGAFTSVILSTSNGSTYGHSGLVINIAGVTSGASVVLDRVSVPAHTITVTGTTNITTSTGFNMVNFGRPTYTDSSAVTVDIGATVYIANSPLAAGSLTLTTPLSLWVDAGTTRLDGDFDHNGTNFGALGATPAAQQSHIADPSGGAVQDTESRTAIASILNALETFGFLATA